MSVKGTLGDAEVQVIAGTAGALAVPGGAAPLGWLTRPSALNTTVSALRDSISHLPRISFEIEFAARAIFKLSQPCKPTKVADKETIHATVTHWKKEYVRGIVHTNTLENVWGLFKRSIIGSYHQVSVKHLDRYLDEFEFRFNNRNNPDLFRDTLLRLLQTSNLEYKNLTKDQAA